MSGQLLSQRDIAKHIGKAFSTVSGYVDQFPEFFEHNGENGLTRRYYPQALAVAEAISELKSQRLPAEEIRGLLSEKFNSQLIEHPVECSENDGWRHSMNSSSSILPPGATPIDTDTALREQLLAQETSDETAEEHSLAGTFRAFVERSERPSDPESVECSAEQSLNTPLGSPELLEQDGLTVRQNAQLESPTPSSVWDVHLAELTQMIAAQNARLAGLEERIQGILEIQAATIREREQHQAEMEADLLERDKMMVSWVKSLHSQPHTPVGWLRKLWIRSPFNQPKQR